MDRDVVRLLNLQELGLVFSAAVTNQQMDWDVARLLNVQELGLVFSTAITERLLYLFIFKSSPC